MSNQVQAVKFYIAQELAVEFLQNQRARKCIA